MIKDKNNTMNQFKGQFRTFWNNENVINESTIESNHVLFNIQFRINVNNYVNTFCFEYFLVAKKRKRK